MHRQSILLLIAVFIACLMDGLDGSIVNVALPTMADTFGIDTGTVSWTAIAYLLIIAGTILIFGNLAAKGMLKRLFITGFFLFTLASLICGFAPTFPVLIAARFLQGLGGSMIIACAPIICLKYLPREYLGFAFGLMAAATFTGFALGPALGGVLTHLLSWHWVFWINVPIGIAALIYILKIMPKGTETFDAARNSFDIKGAIALFIAMIAATLFLERIPHMGFLHPLMIASLVLGIISIIYFICHVRKTANPLLNIRVFRLPPVTFSILAYLIIQLVFSGLLYLLPFYFTNQFSIDALGVGLLLLIQPVITALLGTAFGKWSDRHGRRIFCVIACLMLAGVSGIFAFINPALGLIPCILTLIVTGISLAMACGPAATQIVDQMPESDRETGSTISIAIVYLAAVLGTALYAALFTAFTAEGGTVLSFADLPTALFFTGFQGTMIAGAILSAIAAFLSFLVKNKRMQQRTEQTENS
ncbi:MAG TPA: MFS transporter [Methanocorpusculum sp.]|nr:MFS transporter [Methanocorpusculum sp.]